MTVESHDGFGQVTVVPATRLLVRDDYGQPILLAVKYAGTIVVHRASGARDAEFDRALRAFGVAQTAVVTEADSSAAQILV